MARKKVETIEVSAQFEDEPAIPLKTITLDCDDDLDALQELIDYSREKLIQKSAIEELQKMVRPFRDESDEDLLDRLQAIFDELAKRGIEHNWGPKKPVFSSVLLEAENLVNGQRQKDYGNPKTNHSRIAALWSSYLDYRPGWEKEDCHNLAPSEVALMMVLMKVARAQQGAVYGDTNRDSLVDISGYAGVVELIER